MTIPFPTREKCPQAPAAAVRHQIVSDIAEHLRRLLFAKQNLVAPSLVSAGLTITSESTNKHYKKCVTIPSGAMCAALKVSVHFAKNKDVKSPYDTYYLVMAQMDEALMAVDSGFCNVAEMTRADQLGIMKTIMDGISMSSKSNKSPAEVAMEADVLAKRHAPLDTALPSWSQGELF